MVRENVKHAVSEVALGEPRNVVMALAQELATALLSEQHLLARIAASDLRCQALASDRAACSVVDESARKADVGGV